jgi:hypothetical protein
MTQTTTTEIAAPSPDELTERRYLKALGELVDEAFDNKSAHVLADSLAWTLARIAASYPNPLVTGDILRRLGRYLYEITEYGIAKAEAEQARKDGVTTH